MADSEVNYQPPPTGLSVPRSDVPPLLSPDGNFVWDGSRWISLLSPDGQMRWDGQRWLPVISSARVPSVNGYPVQMAPKNAGLAVLGSFFFPGVGSMMNGDWGMGFLIAGAHYGSILLFILTVWFLVGFLFLPVIVGVWIWGMFHAYNGAKTWNTAHGIIS